MALTRENEKNRTIGKGILSILLVCLMLSACGNNSSQEAPVSTETVQAALFEKTEEQNDSNADKRDLEEPVHIKAISFDDPSDVMLRVGQGTKARVTVTLKKKLEYSRDDIRFVSENPEIALITCVNSLYGEYYFYTIKALSEGKTTVYAESKDGSITSQKIRVIVRDEILVEQITLSQTEADLVLGETIPITAEIFPANAENPGISWTSDNREVATVDWDGHVYAVSEGTATINATSMNGVSSSAKITVDGTKRLMQVSAALSEDGEWDIATEINGEPVGQETVISAGDTLDIYVKCEGPAENPFSMEGTASYTVTEEDFLNGFIVSVGPVAYKIDSGEGEQIFVTVDFSIAGEKAYVWEKDLEKSDENDPEELMVFYIRLNPDRTFEYHVRPHSDHIGSGHWTKSGDIITLKEDGAGFDKVFHFLDQGDRLVFIEGGSDDFGGADVEDGDSFLYREEYDPQ